MSAGPSQAGGPGAAWDDVLPLLRGPAAERLLGGRAVASVRRAAGAYSSSFSIEDVELTFDDGTSAPLVLKDLSPGALLDKARRAKPPFLLDPRREIETYRHVLGPYGLGAPAMVGFAADEAAGRYLLLLEKVPGVPLWQVGELAAWRAAARWLAAAHRRLAPDAPALAAPARLIGYDADYYARWRRRAAEAAAVRGDDARRLLGAYDRAVERLLQLPRTVVHGEFHASNVLVEASPAAVRVRPVDWEMAALAPGLMDLADLTAGNWTDAQRDAMAAAYRAAAAAGPAVAGADQPGAGGAGAEYDGAGGAVGAGAEAAGGDFGRDLDCCRLHRAVQWLSWSDDWTPPREHRQDWLADAERVARRLGYWAA